MKLVLAISAAIVALVVWGSGGARALSEMASISGDAALVSAETSLSGAGQVVSIAGRPLSLAEVEAQDPQLTAALPGITIATPGSGSEIIEAPITGLLGRTTCLVLAVVLPPGGDPDGLTPGEHWASTRAVEGRCDATNLPVRLTWTSTPPAFG